MTLHGKAQKQSVTKKLSVQFPPALPQGADPLCQGPAGTYTGKSGLIVFPNPQSCALGLGKGEEKEKEERTTI